MAYMSELVADLQVHSRFARAVSKDMVLPVMAEWAGKKGIDLLATGDWTHPAWMGEIEKNLEEVGGGIYGLKGKRVKFLLSGEVSCIYSQGGRVRRVHCLVFAPGIGVAKKINVELTRRGCKLESDGRPVIGLSLLELAEVVFGVDERCLLIPAHAWTPWFGVYGSRGGFDSLEEAFGKYADRIYAVETGLSSDPEMNWRIEELQKRAIVSFSDAHSPQKLGREMTVFEENVKSKTKNEKQQFKTQNFSYSDVYEAIAERFVGKNEGRLEIAYTVEFYPEEGKYHWDGHRNCGVVQSPEVTRKVGKVCPKCGRELTVGVDYRAGELSEEGLIKIKAKKKIDDNGVVVYKHPTDKSRPGFVKLVPLVEILAEVYGVGVKTGKVGQKYEELVRGFGGERSVLLEKSRGELAAGMEPELVEVIMKVRAGEVKISPGYDGVFGQVEVETVSHEKQMKMFGF